MTLKVRPWVMQSTANSGTLSIFTLLPIQFNSSYRRLLVRNVTLALAFAAVWTVSGCKKTGDGQYEVQKPVVGTETDTVNTPTVETGTVKDTVTVPKVESEKKEVTVPKVEVKKPNQ